MKIRSGFVSNSSSSSFVCKSDITTSDLALIMMHVIEEDRKQWKKEYGEEYTPSEDFVKAKQWLYDNPNFNEPIILPWSTNYETFIWTNDEGICVDTCNNQRWWEFIEYKYISDGFWDNPECTVGQDCEYLDLSTLKMIHKDNFRV